MPATSKELARVPVLRKISVLCKEFLQHVITVYAKVKSAVNDRTAWKRDRKYFTTMNENMKFLSATIAFLMLIVEEQSRNEDFSTVFPILCFNLAGSIASCAANNQFPRLIAMILAFSSDQPLSQVNLLSKKEVVAFWGNVLDYFTRMKV